MRNEWIIDVLADLRAFAELNGMDATAAQLEDASLVALAELSAIDRKSGHGEGAMIHGHDGKVGNVTHLFARRSLA